LEAKSELRLTLIGTATQLVKLREEEGDSNGHNEDQVTTLSKTSDSDLGSFNSQLKQIELDWSSLLADTSVIQQALHKVRRFLM